MFGGDVIESLCEDRITETASHAWGSEAQVEDADTGVGLGADDLLLQLVEEIGRYDVVAGNKALSGHEGDVEVAAARGFQSCFDVGIQCPGAGNETGDERSVCEFAIGGVDRIGPPGAPGRKRRNVGDTPIDDADDRCAVLGRSGKFRGQRRLGPVQRSDFERRRQADAPYQGLGRHLFEEVLMTFHGNVLRGRSEGSARRRFVGWRRVAERKGNQ